MRNLTVLLGSGFSQGLGLPGTSNFTNIVRGPVNESAQALGFQHHTYGALGQVDTAQAMWRMAEGYYDSLNFENVLHLAETVLAYRNIKGWLSAADRAKPAYGAFMNVMPHWKDVIDHEVHFSLEHFIENSMNQIAKSLIDSALKLTKDQLDHASLLFNQLARSFALTIATLNYDDVVERSIGEWNDGFERHDDQQVFAPLRLLDVSAVPRLLHLHGSVRFFVNSEGQGPRISRGDSSAQADAPQGRRVFIKFTEAGEPVVLGPMISGLRKSDKVSFAPYGYYNWALRDSMIRNPRALIVGYGGFDAYISEIITSIQDVHGEAARVVFVGLRDSGKPITDFSFLVPLYFLRPDPQVTLDAWGQRLDAMVGSRSWHGEKTCRFFVDGFPLSEAEITEMVTFLNS